MQKNRTTGRKNWLIETRNLGEEFWNQQVRIKARRLGPRWSKTLKLESCHGMKYVPERYVEAAVLRTCECDFIWNRVFADTVKSWGCTLIQYDCPFKKRKMPPKHRHMKKTVWLESWKLEWCSCKPENDSYQWLPPEARRGNKGFYPESQREYGPFDALILDFWLPELWENILLLF